MRRSFVLACFGLAFLFVQPATDALGQPPDFLRNYRFLPWHSTLHVTGGFAGFDIEANIFGKYGLVTGFNIGGPILPSLDPFAKFVDVRAQAINPTDFGPYSFELDATLNLSGLEGEPLPIFFPAVLPNINVYKFKGVDGQGAPIKVHALTIGRWMFMKGENNAPCCDFFNYEFRSLARQAPFADVNDDDVVDDYDLARMMSNFGAYSAADDMSSSGDTDSDGDIDGTDVLAWQRQHGERTPLDDFDAMLTNILATSAASVEAVPEPCSLVLVSLALAASFAIRRRP